MTEPTTYGEWIDLDLPMRWSIVDDATDDVQGWLLHLEAGVPDGMYEVVDDAYGGRGGKLMVRDGKFDPETTAHACYTAVCRGRHGMPDAMIETNPAIDHVYIEEMKWDGEVFRLTVGS